MASNLDRATMALRNADAAGDVSAATKLAGYVRSLMPAMDRPPTSPIAKAAQSMRQPAPAPQMPPTQAPSPIARVNQQAVAQRPPGPPVTSLASPMAEAILGVLPGSGDAMAAKESQQAGQAMADALRGGDYGKAASSGIEAAVLGLGALPMIPALGGMIKAWHGSPHSFDAFDISKIGTGEGAQAYGHGLYFAENPKVAGSYRQGLSVRNVGGAAGPNWDDPQHVAAAWVQIKGDKAKALQYLEGIPSANKDEAVQGAIDLLKTDGPLPKVDTGALYNVSLDVNPEDLLDWDAPLSQQSEKVKKAISVNPVWVPQDITDWTGREYYRRLGKEAAKKQGKQFDLTDDPAFHSANLTPSQVDEMSSRALADAGIPGLRYLDAGSRAGGEGSRNVVMFTDKGIKIEGKQ